MEAKNYPDGGSVIPLCPVCGRELDEAQKKENGWLCKCGELIPQGLALNPLEGCTHGRNCNCGRARPGTR